MSINFVVSGSLAQRPGKGGHAWAILQWVLGLRRLGHEVTFVDRLEPDMCLDATGRREPVTSYVRRFLDLLDGFRLGESFSLSVEGGTVGLDRRTLLEKMSDGVLVDLNGFHSGDEELLEHARRRIHVDIDPGFGQIWHQLGLARPFDAYDDLVTVGTGVGRPWCEVPTLGRQWTTTLPPVFLPEWPERPLRSHSFTSVATWRGPFEAIDYEGRRLGLRVHEFRQFAQLPELTGQRFEIALDIDEADAEDRANLVAGRWLIADPATVASDPWTYRSWIERSGAEICIAKQLYVETRGGWFSDRSACYLATGRPVVAQDTCFEPAIPAGKGLLVFSTLEDAAEAVAAVVDDWDNHASAARGLAEDHLDSDRVLRRLLDQLEIR